MKVFFLVSVLCTLLSSIDAQCECNPKQQRAIPTECEVDALMKLMGAAIKQTVALAPQWIRLAFHDAGTFNKNSNRGGANGCLLSHKPMRQQDENHSLDLALETLESIKEIWMSQSKVCVSVSNAHMIQFVGFFAVVRQMGNTGMKPSKRSKIQTSFKWGRPDERNCKTGWVKCLPGFELGTTPTGNIVKRCTMAGKEIKDKMMGCNGFTASESAALLGAHTIGITRNVFPGFQFPWNSNGSDDATTRGPQFDNAFHKFLSESIKAKRAKEFPDNPDPLVQTFPDWHHDPVNKINHFDTDLAIAFPSEDTNIHPDFHNFTRQFAKSNTAFLTAFMGAFDKMSKLGVSKTLVLSLPCEGCVPFVSDTDEQISLVKLSQAVIEASSQLALTKQQRAAINKFQTTPII